MPEIFIGRRGQAHLRSGVNHPLRLVWETAAFAEPVASRLRVSPRQYHTCSAAGPLNPLLTGVAWHECDNLLQELPRLSIHTPWREWQGHEVALMRQVQGDRTFPLFAFLGNLVLAERGALAVRSEEGLWAQCFRQGWPVTPPFLVAENPGGIALMVAASLSPEWFTGLPFTPEAVEKAVPGGARDHVTVEWHEENDLVPECPFDPSCILHAETIHRWL